MTLPEYQTRRKLEALPRWREAFAMRESGQKLRVIGAKFNTCAGRASRMIQNYIEHTLNQKINTQ